MAKEKIDLSTLEPQESIGVFGVVAPHAKWVVSYAKKDRVVLICNDTREKLILSLIVGIGNGAKIHAAYFAMSETADVTMEIKVGDLPDDNVWKQYFQNEAK